MNKIKGLFILAYALLMTACSSNPAIDSQVHESNSLITALHAARELTDEYDEEDILVIFDLDNTLLTMNTAFGSNAWWDWQSELSKKDKDQCIPERVPNVLDVQGAAFFASSMSQTQPDVTSIVRQLQDEEFRVMVLTARGSQYRLPTFRELRRNNLDFSNHAIPMDDDTNFRGLTFFPSSDSRAVLYEDGVYMVSGQHKGKMLQALIERLDWEPDAVVMMDDTEKNIEAMRTSLGLLNIPYRLYRYSGMDTKAKNFDEDKAFRQWQQAAPALEQLEDVFGNANYDLPSPHTDPACR